MGQRSKAPGHNKKKVNNHPRLLKKLSVRAKRKQTGKKEKHEEHMKAVAAPARTGKARTKQARLLKRKIKELAASGAVSAEDFEMADAAAAVETGGSKRVTRGTKQKKKATSTAETAPMDE